MFVMSSQRGNKVNYTYKKYRNQDHERILPPLTSRFKVIAIL